MDNFSCISSTVLPVGGIGGVSFLVLLWWWWWCWSPFVVWSVGWSVAQQVRGKPLGNTNGGLWLLLLVLPVVLPSLYCCPKVNPIVKEIPVTTIPRNIRDSRCGGNVHDDAAVVEGEDDEDEEGEEEVDIGRDCGVNRNDNGRNRSVSVENDVCVGNARNSTEAVVPRPTTHAYR